MLGVRLRVAAGSEVVASRIVIPGRHSQGGAVAASIAIQVRAKGLAALVLGSLGVCQSYSQRMLLAASFRRVHVLVHKQATNASILKPLSRHYSSKKDGVRVLFFGTGHVALASAKLLHSRKGTF